MPQGPDFSTARPADDFSGLSAVSDLSLGDGTSGAVVVSCEPLVLKGPAPRFGWLDQVDPAVFHGQFLEIPRPERANHQIRGLENILRSDLRKPIDIARLIENGFVMVNSFGGNARPIIGRVGERDYCGKVLLTREEVQYAQQYFIQPGMDRAFLEGLALEIRSFVATAAMLSIDARFFVKTPNGEPPMGAPMLLANFLGANSQEILNTCCRRCHDFGLSFVSLDSASTWRLLCETTGAVRDKFGNWVVDQIYGLGPSAISIAYEETSLAERRVPVLTELEPGSAFFPRRMQAVNIVMGRPPKTVVLSDAVAYLISRGISFSSESESGDPTYATLEECGSIIQRRNDSSSLEALRAKQKEIVESAKAIFFDKLAAALRAKTPEPTEWGLGPLRLVFGPPAYSLTGPDLRLLYEGRADKLEYDFSADKAERLRRAAEKKDIGMWLQICGEASEL